MKTWEQLGADATRRASTVARALAEQLDMLIAQMNARASAETFERERLALFERALRGVFLDGARVGMGGVQ